MSYINNNHGETRQLYLRQSPLITIEEEPLKTAEKPQTASIKKYKLLKTIGKGFCSK